MSKRHLKDPVRIQIAKEPLAKGVAPLVRQSAYIIPRASKLAALGRILDIESPESALIFCRTRTEVDMLAQRLSAHGYRSQAMHGGISQDQRTRVIAQLKQGAIDLVVATDVAARGLDIEQLSHVINYDVPTSPEAYVHRIGRVGRAGREGVAITLADPRESRLLKQFEREIKRKIEIEQVPTVADLRARRVESTRTTIEEVLREGDLNAYRSVVESLAQEHDLMDVALAAVKALMQAEEGDQKEEEVIPDYSKMPSGAAGGKAPKGKGRGKKRGGSQPGIGRVYINVGRKAGVRPGDLVGAIAGESGISGQQIGGIDVADYFSVVDLPEEVIEHVIKSMRGANVKGKAIRIRRFNEE